MLYLAPLTLFGPARLGRRTEWRVSASACQAAERSAECCTEEGLTHGGSKREESVQPLATLEASRLREATADRSDVHRAIGGRLDADARCVTKRTAAFEENRA